MSMATGKAAHSFFRRLGFEIGLYRSTSAGGAAEGGQGQAPRAAPGFGTIIPEPWRATERKPLVLGADSRYFEFQRAERH
jgi:hypothetical protein